MLSLVVALIYWFGYRDGYRTGKREAESLPSYNVFTDVRTP